MKSKLDKSQNKEEIQKSVMWLFFVCLFFVFSRAAPMAHGDSQARGLIRAVAISLHQSHSNARSELRLRPTLQLMATLDP